MIYLGSSASDSPDRSDRSLVCHSPRDHDAHSSRQSWRGRALSVGT
ncbi:hypothetical protein ACFFX0_23615 [Citricoccus parietis]|uniref:Uncharacterized protein n=1 Tax=Citricoccus parietis TaxID=592307 RepID=A0ABV5G4Y4_9MICC